MTVLVPDASLVSAAVFSSQRNPWAEDVLHAARPLAGPLVLRQEVYNAALKLERRRLLTSAAMELALRSFEALSISYLWDDSWVPRALRLARQFSLGLYDTIYLVCAEDLDAELWTCDRQFIARFGVSRPPRLKLCPDDPLPGAAR